MTSRERLTDRSDTTSDNHGRPPAPPSVASPEEQLTLLDLLDRVLDKGVALSGDITLSVADVDLVYLGLRVLLSSVEAAERVRRGEPAGGA